MWVSMEEFRRRLVVGFAIVRLEEANSEFFEHHFEVEEERETDMSETKREKGIESFSKKTHISDIIIIKNLFRFDLDSTLSQPNPQFFFITLLFFFFSSSSLITYLTSSLSPPCFLHLLRFPSQFPAKVLFHPPSSLAHGGGYQKPKAGPVGGGEEGEEGEGLEMCNGCVS